MTVQNKKTETIEIRVSHAAKMAMIREADTAGLTLSDWVRGRLSDDAATVTTLRRFLKPLAAVGTLAAVAIGGVIALSPQSAEAQNLAVEISGEMTEFLVDAEGKAGFRTREFETIVEMKDGAMKAFAVPGTQTENGEEYWVTLTPKLQTTDLSGQDYVVVNIKLEKDKAGEKTPVINPELSALIGEQAEYYQSLPDGNTVKLRFAPRKI